MGWLEEVVTWYNDNIGDKLEGAADYFQGKGDAIESTITGMTDTPDVSMAGTFDPLKAANSGNTGSRFMSAAEEALRFVNQSRGASAENMNPVSGKARILKAAIPVGLAVLGLSQGMQGGGDDTRSGGQQTPIPGGGTTFNIDDIISKAAGKADEERQGRLEIETPRGVGSRGALPATDQSLDDYITNSAKDTPLDIDAIAERYGGEVSPSGGILSEKVIPKKEGLIDRGYIEKDGKKLHIYGKPEEKGNGEAQGLVDKDSKIGAFEQAVIKRMGFDPYTFNPAEDARQAVERERDGLFRYVFGGSANPANMTREQMKHWETTLNAFYKQKLSEALIKQKQGENFLNKMVTRFEKEHLEKYGTAAPGSAIWDKKTGRVVANIPKEGQDQANLLPSHVITEIEKVIDKRFMDSADELKLATGAKTYEALPKDKRIEHDTLTENAKKIMQNAIDGKKSMTPEEAVRQAEKGLSSVGGKRLDKATATSILQEAKGDKNKARQIAKERGYNLL